MTTILQLNTSIFGDEGQSSGLADHFVRRWRDRETGVRVKKRDFAQDPVPHLTADRFQAALTPANERTADQAASAVIADEYVDELVAADVLVIGLPMYNFNVPSTLKAWFDHVARAGTTFRYTANGSEGLLKGKKAFVFVARGGTYSEDTDLQTPYVRMFLNFLGIDDVQFIVAEGLAMHENDRHKALEDANARIAALAA